MMPIDRLQIVLFVMVSGAAWACLLAIACGMLLLVARRHATLRTGFATGLFAVIAIQALVAAAAGVITDGDSLDTFACLSGAFGVLLVPVVSLVELGAFAVLWKRRRGSADVSWSGAAILACLWLLLKSATWLVFLRSGSLCTV